jgi:plastocyanin
VSDQTAFYVLAICLVLVGVAIMATGLRRPSFPPKPALAGILIVFALLVGATMTFSVKNAQTEESNRNEELAASAQEARTAQGPSAGPATTLDVTSPASGATEFNPKGLQAKAGNVTISYDNPSPVSHSIALEDVNGTQLVASNTIANGTVRITRQLAPGQYTFYCTVPGHRQAGMEGTLTVAGSQK